MDERKIDVSVLMLGIDARARARVQDAMREIAEKGDTSGPAGLVSMLREAIGVLRGAEDAWTHAGAQNHLPMEPGEAEPAFVLATHAARSRFERELIRNYAGTTTTAEAPPQLANDGSDGVVVVTLVVAARVELTDVADVRDRPALERAFDALSAIEPADFVAMEVIWSPADEREHVSAEAIEKRYPELVRLAAREA